MFKQVITLIKNKEHLTQAGLDKIVSIKASLNNGLYPDLQNVFTNCTPVVRPNIPLVKPTPNWIAGL